MRCFNRKHPIGWFADKKSEKMVLRMQRHFAISPLDHSGPRQSGVNIAAFGRFRREAHQLVVESTTAVVDLMCQRGVGPVQIVS